MTHTLCCVQDKVHKGDAPHALHTDCKFIRKLTVKTEGQRRKEMLVQMLRYLKTPPSLSTFYISSRPITA